MNVLVKNLPDEKLIEAVFLVVIGFFLSFFSFVNSTAQRAFVAVVMIVCTMLFFFKEKPT